MKIKTSMLIVLAMTICMIVSNLLIVNIYADTPPTESEAGKNEEQIRSVSTGFSVSYYYGGTAADKNRVDNYTKDITASAQIGLLGGGNNTLGGMTSLTGESGGYSPSGTYLITLEG